jgi:hypothetical protein
MVIVESAGVIRSPRSGPRICVEHANAEHKQWRPHQQLHRTPGVLRRGYSTYGLVSDRVLNDLPVIVSKSDATSPVVPAFSTHNVLR